MPEEDMSPGEIGRTLQRIDATVTDLRKGFDGWREILIRLEHRVTENEKDIAQINEERKTEARQRVIDRRLLFTALIAPAVILITGFAFQIILSAAGVL